MQKAGKIFVRISLIPVTRNTFLEKHYSTKTLTTFSKSRQPAGFRKRCSYLVTKSLLASAKSPEIFRCLGNNVAPKMVKSGRVDKARLLFPMYIVDVSIHGCRIQNVMKHNLKEKIFIYEFHKCLAFTFSLLVPKVADP